MVFLVVISLLVAVAAVISLIGVRRREEHAARTMRSVRKALGATGSDADVVLAARSLARVAEDARVRANSYASALQGASVGIAMLSGSGSIAYSNPAAQLLLEGEGERALLRTRVSALAQRVDGTGKSESLEVDIHNPDRRVLLLTAVPVEIEGGGLGSVCLYIEDLSAQRRVDAMRTDFVANASHELKTPLGALSLLAETLADTHDDATRARLAKRLQTEANRMAGVIDDVLRLAETESLGAEYVHASIVGLVTKAASGIETYAKDREIDLVQGDLVDATVAADTEQVVSAIRNLLNNAITYTAVKEEPGVVSYRTFVEDGFAAVEVTDTGIGIPDRYQDRVFERFFRVDRARSRESGGTGLGLSIVKNVAKAHGGSVAISSKAGVGSTFTLSLPIVEDEFGEGHA